MSDDIATYETMQDNAEHAGDVHTLVQILKNAKDEDGETIGFSHHFYTTDGIAHYMAEALLAAGVKLPEPKRHTISGSDSADDDDL